MWAKWLRTGPAFIPNKAPWNAMGRVAVVPNHPNSDRTLSCWVGAGFYHFCAYPGGCANVDYGEMIDGEWNYMHIGYKRNIITNTGQAIG
jgi:hypothetical protein